MENTIPQNNWDGIFFIIQFIGKWEVRETNTWFNFGGPDLNFYTFYV